MFADVAGSMTEVIAAGVEMVQTGTARRSGESLENYCAITFSRVFK
jgi:hypothetical protein